MPGTDNGWHLLYQALIVITHFTVDENKTGLERILKKSPLIAKLLIEPRIDLSGLGARLPSCI